MSGIPFMFKLTDSNLFDIKNDTSIYDLEGGFASNPAFQYFLAPCNISNPKQFPPEFKDYFEGKIRNIETYTCVDDLTRYNFTVYGLYEDDLS